MFMFGWSALMTFGPPDPGPDPPIFVIGSCKQKTKTVGIKVFRTIFTW
jgi:hypothetical protein